MAMCKKSQKNFVFFKEPKNPEKNFERHFYVLNKKYFIISLVGLPVSSRSEKYKCARDALSAVTYTTRNACLQIKNCKK